ncbi:MAG: Formate--tetrahydrofolate ligase, partial [Pseudonocardia sp.]|nr:Formate--tetrahydrofolate ligase [Pseudonocardia sp.]MCW2720636.1 Formate--tetrahydrofolate ligase [Pseudonocardia sp.]MDT7617192.1 Formate--tetrahydrofolate ligase [Pseudonocardiales bacterium]
MSFPSDLAIAEAASLRPLGEVAAGMGIEERLLLPYGRGVAKIDLAA